MRRISKKEYSEALKTIKAYKTQNPAKKRKQVVDKAGDFFSSWDALIKKM